MSIAIFLHFIWIISLINLMTSAAPITFFGYDKGPGETKRLTTYQNSSQASDDFLFRLVGVGTETFESIPVVSAAQLFLDFEGAGTAILSGPGISVDSVSSHGTNGVGRYAISGSRYIETGDKGFTIQFSNPVAAFGFWGVDIGDFGGDLIIQTTTSLYTLDTKNNPGGSVLFWGIIDPEMFTSITFSNTASGVDYFSFDNMTIGSFEQVNLSALEEVPEPFTFAMTGAGLAAFILLVRRQQPNRQQDKFHPTVLYKQKPRS